MFWNYRVIKRIHDDDGKPDLVTEDLCEPQGETLEELKDDVEWYQRALEHPALNYDDFGGDSLTPLNTASTDEFIDLALLSEAALARDWDRPE